MTPTYKTESRQAAHHGAASMFQQLYHAAPWIRCALQNTKTEPTLWHLDTTTVGVSIDRLGVLLEGLSLDALVPIIGAKSRARQLSFIAGRVASEMALRRLGLIDETVGRDPTGIPLWPTGWCGSIAHSNRLAVATISEIGTIRSLGIDVEDVVDRVALHDVSAICLLESERQMLTHSANPEVLATVLFSAKEAYYKAVHPLARRFVEFTEVTIEDLDWKLQTFRVRPRKSAVDLIEVDGRFVVRDAAAVTLVVTRDREQGSQ